MVDTRLPASGNIKVRWHAINAFANPAKPTPAEVNAGTDLTDSISWNDFDFGIQASNTTSDPSLKSRSNVSDRGAMQYGGGISLYHPRDPNDMENEYARAHALLKTPRTRGWLTFQVDGEMSETNTPTYAGGITQEAAEGDLIDVFEVMTAGYSDQITGEEAFRETITFLPQGNAYPHAIVADTAAIEVTPATSTLEVGESTQIEATLNGRVFTRGVRWSSSNPTAVTVSQNGVATRRAAGEAEITATYAGASDSATIE